MKVILNAIILYFIFQFHYDNVGIICSNVPVASVFLLVIPVMVMTTAETTLTKLKMSGYISRVESVLRFYCIK